MIGAPPEMAAASEKEFYLREFRGRTLVLGADPRSLAPAGARLHLRSVLSDLVGAGARLALVIGPWPPGRTSAGRPARRTVDAWLGLSARRPRVVSWPSGERDRGALAVWQALRARPLCLVSASEPALEAAAGLAEAFRAHKLVLLDPRGGLHQAGARRPLSFLDEERLERLLASGVARRHELGRIERALAAGVGSVNLCRAEGLGRELFTYEGSGTYFSRGEYCRLGRLGVDDFAEVERLLARGVREGVLKPRSRREVGEVLLSGFGVWIGGRHLAGVAALRTAPYAAERAGEIVALYTITRFQGEGLGARLLHHLIEEARRMRLGWVFAVTSSDRAVAFFRRLGFSSAPAAALPPAKWVGYPAERRRHARVLRLAL